jgi:hypothetical protein
MLDPKNFKKSSIIIISFLILFSQFPLTHVLSSGTVGVLPGEWIEYSIEWKPSEYYVEGEEPPVKVRREILEVQGSNVTVKITAWYPNGTVSYDVKAGDVVYGTGGVALMIIPANLKEGDTIRIQGLSETNLPKIFGEVEREYLGTIRNVVYSQFTAFGYNITAYWDKLKGVALELKYEHSSRGSSIIVVSATNMFPTFNKSINFGPYFALALTVVALSVFIIIRRGKGRRKRITRKH